MCDAGVNYFSLTQAVDHMVETGQLVKEEERYSLTEKGRRNSEICQNSLPYSVRMHCDENLVRVNQDLRRQAQVQTAITDHEEGTCTLRLRLNDVGSPLLDLELLVPDRVQAADMAASFQRDPASVYHSIAGLLSGREENEGKGAEHP